MWVRVLLFQTLKNLQVFIFTKLLENCCLLLASNSLQKKHYRKSSRQNFDTARTVYSLHSFYNVSLVLHKKGNCFQPIRSEQFFHVYYYSRGKKTWSYSVLGGLFSLRRYKKNGRWKMSLHRPRHENTVWLTHLFTIFFQFRSKAINGVRFGKISL